MDESLILLLAGLLAGAMNAAAGGGSFITFPAMVYIGIPPLIANASSTVALFPGSLAGAWEYRQFIRPFGGVSMPAMILLTFAGGCIGALLLLFTPSGHFNSIVPWLLLTGTLTFAFGKKAGEYLRRKVRIGSLTMYSGQLILGIYGGYFGGAVGIMMMAVWNIFGMSDIRVINANKNLLVGVANSIAVALFIIAGKVSWPETAVMLAATVAGGLLGGRYTRSMDPARLRALISVFNFLITIAFFIRVWLFKS